MAAEGGRKTAPQLKRAARLRLGRFDVEYVFADLDEDLGVAAANVPCSVKFALAFHVGEEGE